ncbi:type VI secretion system baseplate subunit TssG [Aliikangiella sp. IMCC44359]|uniref:type VI secretion system baseplate subunit TssG n=1 Tax=Aliikangiella sp. IMCC44359 TaxID=3459125 RepID=UPI00403B2E4C
MAAHERSQSSCLDLLQQQGHEFDFFQAVRLLEKSTGPEKKVKFKAVNSEAFHSNFIAGIENTNNRIKKPITVSVNGFGLTGQQGPIPACFSEMFRRAAVSGKKGAEDPHAFLDIFNDKHLALLYQIKKNFDLMLFNENPDESILYQMLSSITGFDTLSLFDRLPIAKDKLAVFAPIISNRRVDYSLIYNVLKCYLNCDVKVTPNCGAWRTLPEQYQAKLSFSSKEKSNDESSQKYFHQSSNNGMRLGGGVGLGKKYWDNQAAIRIDINMSDIEKLRGLLPGGKEHKALKALLSFLTDAKYFIGIRLLINWKDIPQSKLYRTTKLKLGQTSWLKSDQKNKTKINYPQFVIKPSVAYSFSSEPTGVNV